MRRRGRKLSACGGRFGVAAALATAAGLGRHLALSALVAARLCLSHLGVGGRELWAARQACAPFGEQPLPALQGAEAPRLSWYKPRPPPAWEGDDIATTLVEAEAAMARAIESYLPTGCSDATRAALRHRWRLLPEAERPLLPMVLRRLLALRAGAPLIVAAALSGGSVAVLGEGAGLTRQEAEAAYGDRAAFRLVELQQLAAVERALLELVPAAAPSVEDGPASLATDAPQPPQLPQLLQLPPGLVDLGLSLLTAQRTLSGSSQSLILFLVQKAAQLRLHVAQLQRQPPSAERLRAGAVARDIFAPLANLMGLGEIKEELEDASFELMHPEERAYVLSELGYLDPGAPATPRAVLLSATSSLQAALTAAINSGALAGLRSLRVLGRAKSAYSAWCKSGRNGLMCIEQHDLAAARVIVDAETEAEAERLCYIVQEVVRGLWPALRERDKDYIAHPKANGYRSLHLVLTPDPSSWPLELQLRTEAMHRQAEYGSSGHWEYKAGAAVQPSEAAERAGADLFALLDADGDGRIGAAELRRARARARGAPELPVLEEAQLMLEVLDADGDGAVGFSDFWNSLVTTWFPLVSGTHRPRKPDTPGRELGAAPEGEPS